MTAGSAKRVLGSLLDAIVARDMDRVASLFADDVRFWMPFPPEGAPNPLRVEGREELEGMFRAAHSQFAKFEFQDLELFGTDDLEVAIATCGCQVALSDGRDYSNDLVFYARVKDGAITEYREYMDPIRASASAQP